MHGTDWPGAMWLQLPCMGSHFGNEENARAAQKRQPAIRPHQAGHKHACGTSTGLTCVGLFMCLLLLRCRSHTSGEYAYQGVSFTSMLSWAGNGVLGAQ